QEPQSAECAGGHRGLGCACWPYRQLSPDPRWPDCLAGQGIIGECRDACVGDMHVALRARRTMSGSHCTFFPDRLLEREHNGYACEAHQGHVPKIVDIGPEAGLSGKGSSYERVRALQCCNRRGSLREQIALHLLNGVT